MEAIKKVNKKSIASKLVSMLCAIILIGACVSAYGEDTKLQSSVQSVVDSITSAAIISGESSPVDNGMLSGKFADCFFSPENEKLLNILPDVESSADTMKAYLESIIQCSAENTSPVAYKENGESFYIGVKMMTCDFSPDENAVRIIGDVYKASSSLNDETTSDVTWLNKRAVAELRRNSSSPAGWIVTSFSLDNELEMEQATGEFFARTLIEYSSPEAGFAISYPAEFGENVKTDQNGISGSLTEGTASFFAQHEISTKLWTTEELYDGFIKNCPDADVTYNEETGSITVKRMRNDESTQLDVYILATSCDIYHMQLIYDKYQFQNYSLYGDYMTNSFTVLDMVCG